MIERMTGEALREVMRRFPAPDWLEPFAEPSACAGHLTGA
jgi:hypothetical protein